MKHTVFIQTNAKQIVGARVSDYLLKRNSRAPQRFDVRIIHAEDFPFLAQREGQAYLRDGARPIWRNHDLQSFPPLRFAVPALMGYRGRALVIDPDVFAVGDVNELFQRDMGTAAILARPADAKTGPGRAPLYASSVMLLDCARLHHWNAEADFARLFAFERDYRDWMWLLDEAPGIVAPLETVWNDFDRLAPETRLLHNTRRRTQPWKTGLPADFQTHGTSFGARSRIALRRLKSTLLRDGAPYGYYQPHPDPAQERFFFQMLAECVDRDLIAPALLRAEIERKHLRADAFELLAQARGTSADLAA